MEDQFKEMEIRKEKQREKELEARRNAKREMNKSSGSFSSLKIKKVTRRKSQDRFQYTKFHTQTKINRSHTNKSLKI